MMGVSGEGRGHANLTRHVRCGSVTAQSGKWWLLTVTWVRQRCLPPDQWPRNRRPRSQSASCMPYRLMSHHNSTPHPPRPCGILRGCSAKHPADPNILHHASPNRRIVCGQRESGASGSGNAMLTRHTPAVVSRARACGQLRYVNATNGVRIWGFVRNLPGTRVTPSVDSTCIPPGSV
jgi:hypothetical protein